MTKVSGSVHIYNRSKTAFEFGDSKPKVVLFIGGLTDGLLTVHYLPKLAEALSSIGWGLVQANLSSSYNGFGQTSLERDNKEMAQLIKYLRSSEGGARTKIVLMGHSTGCQDTIRFLTQHDPTGVDGGIMQAPVSDREGTVEIVGEQVLDQLVQEVYDEYITKGLSQQMLPLKFTKVSFGVPTTAYRFYSLYSKYGDDDFFSTYFTDDEIKNHFGKVQRPLLVLYGEKDEYAPKNVNLNEFINRWKKYVGVHWSPLSKVLKNANHTVDDEDAVQDLLTTVKKFVTSLQ